VQVRVFMGVGAWLVGVGAATAGSLVAVSLLGQGIAPSTSQQLSSGAVNQALAVEATETSGPPLGSPSPAPSRERPRKTPTPSVPPSQTQPSPQVRPAATRPSPTHSTQPTSNASSALPTTVLTSQGGTVVAECPSGKAYLVSWSPTQGYEVEAVTRGPAAAAQVTFNSDANIVTMVVSCPAGTPTAATTVSPVVSGTHADE
jgi:eukaryotic-like serine/threonine-protein kinase